MFFVRTLLLMLFSTVAFAEQSFKRLEHRCLALNIYYEARSENVQGQLAVGIVTLNRVKNSKYPNTICEVVWQRKQFSWTHDGKSDKPKEKIAWQKAKEMAAHLITSYEISKGAIDFTDGSIYYYAHNIVTPYWADSMYQTTIIGNHTFGR